jgi:tripeptide aminopeptidase
MDSPDRDQLHALRDRLTVFRERILADLIQLAQMRTPSGQEGARVRFLRDRLTQGGVPNVGQDEVGNAVGVIPGLEQIRSIMIVAHLDSALTTETDVNVTIKDDRAVGAGISGTPLSTAMLCVLPEVLEHLGIRLKSTLVLLGSVSSRGQSDKNGLNRHLTHTELKPDVGLVLEGLPLGKVNCFSIGSVRGNIHVNTEGRVHIGYGAESALVVVTRIVNRMLEIAVPRRPYTEIRLGRLRAGYSHDIEPDEAILGFEVVSYDEGIMQSVLERIQDAIAEMASRYQATVDLDVFHSRSAGGLSFTHPLVKHARAVLEALDVEPVQNHTAGELSHFISRDIPALTLGISKGKRNLASNDYVLIEPLYAGLAQLVGLLQEIDTGNCDADVDYATPAAGPSNVPIGN